MQLHTMVLMVSLLFKIQNLRDKEADTTADPACISRSCPDLTINLVSLYYTGSRIGWRFLYGKLASRILPPTRKRPRVSKKKLMSQELARQSQFPFAVQTLNLIEEGRLMDSTAPKLLGMFDLSTARMEHFTLSSSLALQLLTNLNLHAVIRRKRI